MMRLRTSLFAKILLWFFLNLVVLAGGLFAVFDAQVRLRKDSFWFGGNRVDFVAGRISEDLRGTPEAERGAVLARYASAYRVDFLLLANNGERMAGPEIGIPPEVARYVGGPMPPPPPPPPGRDRPATGPRGAELRGERRGPPPRAQAVFMQTTSGPTRYWGGVRIPVFEPGRDRPDLATLLAVSDSMSGHGLFFDLRPWLLMAGGLLAVSILLWVPFVRGLTGSLREMTKATEQIAEEQFDVRVDEARTDELGRLGVAINHLAARLSGFVGGQKRFLGDIAHELNSPLGRLQVALGILEDRVAGEQRAYVGDAQEEVAAMSQLVSELLAFSRAGMRARELPLGAVSLRPLVEQQLEREACGARVVLDVPTELTVLAHPELLGRAFANVLRNAARYAAGAGPVLVAAERLGDEVVVRVSDEGPGVPAGAVGRLFDPFFRLEPDRDRSTGGAGLGLAIVKTCVEACRGRVAARNLVPHGLEITFTLTSADGRSTTEN
jgi:two-component system, OmpR family, sensor histidine kinase CpxA